MNLPPYGDNFRRENMPFSTLKVTAQSTPDMTVRVSPGTFWINSKRIVEFVGGNSPQFTAPSSNAKWCLLVLRQQGTLDIVDGQESANPVPPDCPRNTFPLCLIYLQATDTAISYDMINEIRPVFNISTQNVQDLDGLDTNNLHPISSIENLQTELDDRYTQNQIQNLLNNKADSDGTKEEIFVLNKDFTGTPGSNCGIEVERGTEGNAAIRYNESTNVWQYTNDGSNWVDLTNSGVGVPIATDTTAGIVIVKDGLTIDGTGNLSVENIFTSAEKTKLAGIEDGAEVNPTAAEIKTAYESNSDTNAYTDAEKTKLAGIEDNATADMTGAEIKAAYEAEADTNAYTDAEKTKLAGIEDNATADMTAAEIKTAYESNNDTNAYTDAEKTVVAKVFQSGDTASRPASPVVGESYFDTDLGKPIWFDGTNWVDATGTTV